MPCCYFVVDRCLETLQSVDACATTAKAQGVEAFQWSPVLDYTTLNRHVWLCVVSPVRVLVPGYDAPLDRAFHYHPPAPRSHNSGAAQIALTPVSLKTPSGLKYAIIDLGAADSASSQHGR